MIAHIRRRLHRHHPEAGLTLIEILVSITMSVVIVAGATAMLISAVHDQPALSRKAQNVSTARWQLERIVREIRNGVTVEPSSSPSQLTIVTRVRRVQCGGAVPTDPAAQAIKCKVTYTCAGPTCTRTEATLTGQVVGIAETALSGVRNPGAVFCFVPSAAPDPTECAAAKSGGAPTYVGVELEVPNPDGPGLMNITDGATLRSATFNG
jgi:Tfp pilus assembly protein PilV